MKVPGRRPAANYYECNGTAVDVIAEFFSEPDDPYRVEEVRYKLRAAVIEADRIGVRKAAVRHSEDYAREDADVSGKALNALADLVQDPTFLPALLKAGPVVQRENSMYGQRLWSLFEVLNNVTLLQQVHLSEARKIKKTERTNPGEIYLQGLYGSLVMFWHELTGQWPSKTRKITTTTTRSARSHFWDFADAACADLRITAPAEHFIRRAISEGVKLPSK